MLLTKQAEEPGRGRLETSGHPKEHRHELCMCPSSTPYWSFGTWSLKKLIIRNMVNLSRADSPALAREPRRAGLTWWQTFRQKTLGSKYRRKICDPIPPMSTPSSPGYNEGPSPSMLGPAPSAQGWQCLQAAVLWDHMETRSEESGSQCVGGGGRASLQGWWEIITFCTC